MARNLTTLMKANLLDKVVHPRKPYKRYLNKGNRPSAPFLADGGEVEEYKDGTKLDKKEYIKKEKAFIQTPEYLKLLKAEHGLGADEGSRNKANAIIRKRLTALDELSLKEDPEGVAKQGAAGYYDPSDKSIRYDSKKPNLQSILDHEVSHALDHPEAPGKEFTAKLYDIYKKQGLLSKKGKFEPRKESADPIMTSDEYFESIDEKQSNIERDFAKQLPDFAKQWDTSKGVYYYIDKKTNKRYEAKDMPKHIEKNYSDVFNDPSNWKKELEHLKAYSAPNQSGRFDWEYMMDELNDEQKEYVNFIKKSKHLKREQKTLEKELPPIDEYNDLSNKGFFKETTKEGADLFNKNKKRDIVNVGWKGEDAFNLENITKSGKEDDPLYFLKGTEAKARLKSIRREAIKQGYKLGTSFEGWLDKSKGNKVLQDQYDDLKKHNKFSDKDINELMLLFAKNESKDSGVLTAKNGGLLPKNLNAMKKGGKVKKYAMGGELIEDYRGKEMRKSSAEVSATAPERPETQKEKELRVQKEKFAEMGLTGDVKARKDRKTALGRFFEDTQVGAGLHDIGAGTADFLLGTTIDPLIGKDTFNPKMRTEQGEQMQSATKASSEMASKILPLVANIVAPGAGTGIEMGRAGLNSLTGYQDKDLNMARTEGAGSQLSPELSKVLGGVNDIGMMITGMGSGGGALKKGGKVKGYTAGGQIEGKGTGTSDSIDAKMEGGGFVVPAKNSPLAIKIREQYLNEKGNKKAPLKSGGVPVKVSNGEHYFTEDEVQKLTTMGVNLNKLAPEAKNKLKLKDGGRIKIIHPRKKSKKIGEPTLSQVGMQSQSPLVTSTTPANNVEKKENSPIKKVNPITFFKSGKVAYPEGLKKGGEIQKLSKAGLILKNIFGKKEGGSTVGKALKFAKENPGTILGGLQAATGLRGAKNIEARPEFDTSQFQDIDVRLPITKYIPSARTQLAFDKATEDAKTGLSISERAAMDRDRISTYRAEQKAVREGSGGSGSRYLSNIGAATTRRSTAALKQAALSERLKTDKSKLAYALTQHLDKMGLAGKKLEVAQDATQSKLNLAKGQLLGDLEYKKFIQKHGDITAAEDAAAGLTKAGIGNLIGSLDANMMKKLFASILGGDNGKEMRTPTETDYQSKLGVDSLDTSEVETIV